MPRCRYCPAEIAFVTLPNGKAMPVEGLEPETYYLHLDQPGHPHLVLVLDDGTIVQGRQGQEAESGVCKLEGRESHFARCPGADDARRNAR